MKGRAVLALVATLALGAACSGGGDDAGRTPDTGSGSGGQQTTTTASADDQAAITAAEQYLDSVDSIDDAGRQSLAVTSTQRGAGVTHVHFGQSFDGTPVRGAQVIVHVADDGTVLGANSSYTAARPQEGVEQQVTEEEATDTAAKTAPGNVTNTVSAKVVWLPDGDTLRLGWSVVQSTDAGGYQTWVDAVTGEVADARVLRTSEVARAASADGAGTPQRAAAPAEGGANCQLDESDAPAGCVFETNAFFANGGEEDPDVDDTADLLQPVELQGLDDPSGQHLVGEFVDLESDLDPEDPVVDQDGIWDMGRGEPGFENVMAYFWIDRTQRLIQSLGIDDARNEPFPVIPIDPEVENNAFFDGADQDIHLGIGPEDGINEGEDADGIVHEYGHAILDAQVPGSLGSAGEVGAYHEGFGDILAFLSTLEFRQTDAACLFHWTDQTCLRRMDGDKVYPDDLDGEVHDDGEIMTGAIFDVTEQLLDDAGLTFDDCVGTDACNEVRDHVLRAVLEGNRFLAGNETLPEIAAAIRQANDTAFDGDGDDAFDAAFAAHGLDGGGGHGFDDQGNQDGDLPPVVIAADISHTFRGDLHIEAQVVDADFQPLCDALDLLDPDPQDSAEDVTFAFDVSDTDCAQFVPPSADQQWQLFVVDTADQDFGQVNAFQVLVEGEPFLATGVPAPIADNDPTGTAVIVNDSGSQVDQGGTEEVQDSAPGGVPSVELDVSHTFVGDLSLRVGVADADLNVLCSVPVLQADPTNDSDAGVHGFVDMSTCGQFFPPSADNQWFVEVVDNATQDEGTIDTFRVVDPDGDVLLESDQVPVPIPDADAAGVALVLGA